LAYDKPPPRRLLAVLREKELRLMPILKACDRMTGSRLREVKSFRSMRDMLPLGDGHKDAKLI
jgi:hypothetical protein